MEQLYVFGTGNAHAVECYNTCFAIRKQDEYFMVDAGGGNGILKILRRMQVDTAQIHHLFVSHAHTDHVLGVVWLLRIVAQRMAETNDYDGELHVYCHAELSDVLHTLCKLMISKKARRMLDKRILFHVVQDGEQQEILGNQVTFFDIGSTKMKQFGWTMRLSDGKIVCFAGDEPLQPELEHYAEGADWLLHEAFCCYEDRERFRPYEKNHSTAKDACALAHRLGVKRLVLWHTEDSDLAHRPVFYDFGPDGR